MKLANEFLLRIKLIFFLSLFYSLIFSYYSLELLQFLIEFVSTKINFEIMLTQVEDLSIMLLDLINYSLLLFLSFIFITQLYIFFEPSFFNLEKTKINQLLRLTFIGFLVTLLFFINFFNIFSGFPKNVCNFELCLFKLLSNSFNDSIIN